MSKRKRKRITIIIVIALVAIAGTIFAQQHAGRNQLEWRTMPAGYRTIVSSISATGTINPVTQVSVGTEVSGRIERIYRDFNDVVRRGDLLARLDTTTLAMTLEEMRISMRTSQLTLNENRIELDRMTELHEANMVSGFELQRAQFNYEVASENVERARFAVQRAETNLNNALIHSPIDGVIVSRVVDEGQTVAAGLNAPTLFVIANNLDDMQIEAQIDEADIGRVRDGQRVLFSIDAFPERRFMGQVRQIRLNPIVEQNVVTYRVIISVSNPDQIIMPGMSANVQIIINEVPNVLAVQERALQFRPTREVWEAFGLRWEEELAGRVRGRTPMGGPGGMKIGRASCRERV
jgi:HlyD family secretion protein